NQALPRRTHAGTGGRFIPRVSMATTECPACRSQARVPDSMVGRQVKCPRCNHVFVASALAGEQAPLPATRQEYPVPPPASRDDRPDDRGPRGRPGDDLILAEDDLGPRPRRRSGGGGGVLAIINLILASLALVAAVIALCVVLFKSDPLGKGLRAYDFS